MRPQFSPGPRTPNRLLRRSSVTLGQSRRGALAWLLAGVIGFLGPGAAALAAELRPVTVSLLGYSATMWPLLVAQERGFFTDAGIRVDVIQSGSSAKAAQQTAAGSVNIGNSSTFDAFRAIEGGAGLKIFLSSQAVATHMLFTAKSIKSIRDLKGKRVMTGGPKDITNLWWEAMARNSGLDPQNDVELIFAGATSARYAALIAGGVEGAVLAVPQTFDAQDQGYTNLGFVAPFLGDVPTNVWHVNTQWAKDHEAEVIAFAKANNRGAQFILDPKNREAASEILAKATNLKIDVARRTYDLCIQAKAFKADGDISLAGLERVRALLDAAGDLQKPLKPIDAYFDSRYLTVAKAGK